MHGTQKLELYYRGNSPGADEIRRNPPVVMALALEVQFAGIAFIPLPDTWSRHSALRARNLKNLHKINASKQPGSQPRLFNKAQIFPNDHRSIIRAIFWNFLADPFYLFALNATPRSANVAPI